MFIGTQDALNIAVPSSVQGAFHNITSKYGIACYKSSSCSVIRATIVLEVMGPALTGTLFLSHPCDMQNTTSY